MTTQQLSFDLPMPPPVVPDTAPEHTLRPLTTRDALWPLDSAGRCSYTHLYVQGWPGVVWVARQWMHCGNTEGVLLVRLHDVDQPMAPARWFALADGRVRVRVPVVAQDGKRP